jgi:undecaprenyl-phosphate galactose phosphotransferase/putative colanic acid biosynthesis UDP-glucose lipid carrier transferase
MSSAGRFEDRTVAAFPAFRLPYWGVSALAAISDSIAIIGACVLAQNFRFWTQGGEGDDIGLAEIASVFFLLLAKSWGLYRFQTLLRPNRSFGRCAAASLLSVLAVVCLLFLLKTGSEHSRSAMALFALFSAALVPFGRFVFGFLARALIAVDVVRGRRVVLIGDIRELERLTASEIIHFGFDEVARFAISWSSEDQLSRRGRLRVEQALEASRTLRAAEFALILPWSRDRALSEITSSLRVSPLPVRLYPDHRTRDILLQKRASHFDPYLSVEVQREPLSNWEQHVKRGFDLAIAGMALISLSPLLALTALLIKLDSQGPIIFRQPRLGFDNREFRIWKFRTMTVQEVGATVKQAQRDDERVTPVGKILRRTSVDELPQLVNVLRGDMSIVGPRPHAVAHDEFYEARIGEYALRRHVKPGLTGAAQVDGLRGETRTLKAMEDRIQRDLWYINHWSLWLDVKIIAKTFVALVKHEAY